MAAVRAASRYRAIAEELVRRVAAAELAKRRPFKEAVKAARAKLHQVVGAYGEELPVTAAEGLTRAAGSGDPATLRRCCADLMARHASTRERLPILGEFYATLLGGLGPLRRVLDLACGLNPLAIPWMPLAAGCVYEAYDVDTALVAFLGAALPLLGVAGTAQLVDLTAPPPALTAGEPADVALLLKCLPCLEQLDPAAGQRLLDALPARCLIVSFPVRSLGGRSKGMAAHYDAHFRQLVAGRPWRVERFDFATELAYRLRPGDAEP